MKIDFIPSVKYTHSNQQKITNKNTNNTIITEEKRYIRPSLENYKAIISMKGNRVPHSENEKKFIELRDKFCQKLEQANIASEEACWDFFINSNEKNRKRYEQLKDKEDELFQDKELYEQLKEIAKTGLKDEHLKSHLKDLLEDFEDEFNSGEDIKKLRDKKSLIAAKYNSYTPQIDGQNTSLAEINKILTDEKNVELRKKAYEAKIKGGDLIANDLVELVKLRNEFAQSKGYKNYFEYKLKEVYEVDTDKLQSLMEDVYEQANKTNQKLQIKNKNELAKEFNIEPENLKAYHYGLLLDNNAEKEVNESIKTKEQVVKTAKLAYKNMGYDIDKMPILLDLFPKENKNTHCYCFQIHPGKDARVLANLTNNVYSITSLMHELGHSVYCLGTDNTLPYFDKYPHYALTEAVAFIMEDLPYIENVLKDTVSKDTLNNFKQDFKNTKANFINKCLRTISFEKAMYENPNQDLRKLWHDLSCKYLGRNESEDLNNEWATIPHYLASPVYYQNYFRAELMKAQMYNALTEKLGNITKNPNTANFLNENLFKYGSSLEEDEIIKKFTKQSLSAKAFCESIK